MRLNTTYSMLISIAYTKHNEEIIKLLTGKAFDLKHNHTSFDYCKCSTKLYAILEESLGLKSPPKLFTLK